MTRRRRRESSRFAQRTTVVGKKLIIFRDTSGRRRSFRPVVGSDVRVGRRPLLSYGITMSSLSRIIAGSSYRRLVARRTVPVPVGSPETPFAVPRRRTGADQDERATGRVVGREGGTTGGSDRSRGYFSVSFASRHVCSDGARRRSADRGRSGIES